MRLNIIILLNLFCLMLVTTSCSAQNDCGVMGNISQIVCVGWDTFKLTEDVEDLTVFSCPLGTFCANSLEICVRVGEPACKVAKICSKCLLKSISTCVAQKKYAMCDNGYLIANEKNCQASKPYCSMQYDANGVANAVCTHVIGDIACNNTIVPTPAPNATEPTYPSPTPPCTTLPTPTEPCTPEPSEPSPTEPCVTTPKPPVDPETCSDEKKISITTDIDCKSCDVNISIVIRGKKDKGRN